MKKTKNRKFPGVFLPGRMDDEADDFITCVTNFSSDCERIFAGKYHIENEECDLCRGR